MALKLADQNTFSEPLVIDVLRLRQIKIRPRGISVITDSHWMRQESDGPLSGQN